MKRGRGSRMLLEAEMRNVLKVSSSAADAARKLGISYNTFKKYAKKFNVFTESKSENKPDRNIPGLIKKPKRLNSPTRGKYPIEKIINNECPNFDFKKLKAKLVRAGMKKEVCERCNFSDERIDGRRPILVNFVDGNQKNFNLDNVEFLCFNCYFCYVGDFFGFRRKKVSELF